MVVAHGNCVKVGHCLALSTFVVSIMKNISFSYHSSQSILIREVQIITLVLRTPDLLFGYYENKVPVPVFEYEY